jgi:hypothetical protein
MQFVSATDTLDAKTVNFYAHHAARSIVSHNVPASDFIPHSQGEHVGDTYNHHSFFFAPQSMLPLAFSTPFIQPPMFPNPPRLFS